MRASTQPAPSGSLTGLAGFDRLDGLLLRRLSVRVGPAALRYALGRVSLAPAQEPVATLRFRDRGALLGLLLDPELHFGDAYADSRIEIEGDLVAALAAAYLARSRGRRAAPLAWLSSARHHSLVRARRNVRRHYDIGNDFYALWLDPQLVYTGAYFASPDMTIEQAQVAKLDHVCRKLGLGPTDTVVEAGCGWGALALHIARRYGSRVRAWNVSREQLAFARERARREGLADRVEFLEGDYREIDEPCSAFVSVGMLEHVGRASYGELARVIARSLDRTRGRGLLHFIGRDLPRPLNSWIRRRIFPGAYAPALSEVTRMVLEPAGLSVVDVENLRMHYAVTLRHWRERYERACDEGRVAGGERFRRAWRLYLAGSEAAFRTGSLQLFQVVFAAAGSTTAPWTRRALYDPAGPGLEWNAPRS
jgi:cyclopropane-fatty-acyl-phospholipid synthase